MHAIFSAFNTGYYDDLYIIIIVAVEPLLRGHPDERPPPLERPLYNVNLYINVLISTPDERPPFLKANFLMQKGWPHKRGSSVLLFLYFAFCFI